MPTRKKSGQFQTVDEFQLPSKAETKERVADIRTILDRVKAREGVIGYILRASTSAAVDIKDPSKIIDYAVLSTSALEAAESLAEAFGIGNLNNIVVQGKDLKILLITKGEYRISIFMSKNVDDSQIHKELT